MLQTAMLLLAEPPLPQIGARYYSINQVLSPYVYVFYAAYIVSFLLTPVMRAIATYYGIIDQPDHKRKIHTVPVAYLGGVAVFLGWLAGLAITQFLSVHRLEIDLPRHLVISFSIVVGACIIVAVGLLDDLVGLKPGVKIAGQAAAAVALLVSGVGTQAASVFIMPAISRVHVVFPGIDPIDATHWLVQGTSWLFVIFLVVACCNATNLMDGLDGLCSGVTAVITFGFLALAIHLAMRSGAMNPNEDGLRVVLGLALLGAVLGFIPYNFNPASIFMGDTGSMFLGFVCALMMILFAQADPKWFLAAIIIFALPVLDTTLAFVRRFVNRRPLFSADRHHLHHQLVARGFTVKQTVVISYALAISFALLGTAIVFVRTRYAVALYLVVFGSIIVAAYKMGMVHERARVVTPKPISGNQAEMTGQIEPGTVVEVRRPPERQTLVAASSTEWTNPS
jgi:UDP-GlcNAc:undecaprenyl-phosphate GlcNAc-1-phosphate transferase